MAGPCATQSRLPAPQAGGKEQRTMLGGLPPRRGVGPPVPPRAPKQPMWHSKRSWFRQAAKQAGSAAKKAAAKAGNALRAIYAAAKSLIAAAAAGGSVVLALLVLICVVGLLIASPFGILFANEPADSTSVALSTAIAQINEEYAGKLEELQAGDYDQIIIDGAPAGLAGGRGGVCGENRRDQ